MREPSAARTLGERTPRWQQPAESAILPVRPPTEAAAPHLPTEAAAPHGCAVYVTTAIQGQGHGSVARTLTLQLLGPGTGTATTRVVIGC